MRKLGAFRGIAILLVVLNHSIFLTIQMSQNLGARQLGLGEKYFFDAFELLGIFGVPIFLFIAGSFSVYLFGGKNVKSIIKQLSRYLLLIITPYILWSLVFYLLLSVVYHENYSIAQYAKDIAVGYPYNFVPLLVFFYVVSPLMLYFIRRNQKSTIIVIFLYQVFLNVAMSTNVLSLPYFAWAHILVPPIIRTTFATWGVFFPLGMAFSINNKKVVGYFDGKKKLVIYSIVALFVTFLVLREIGLWTSLVEFICTLLGLALIIVVEREAIPFVQQIENIGKRSYGIYLTHMLVINIAVSAAGYYCSWILDWYYITIPIIFVLSVAIPIGTMKLFEMLPRQVLYRYVFG
jgi:peptidoglycan/LPS O-acetylase OafA/YrhL